MLADDDMTTGFVVHTDGNEDKAIEYRQPRWWVARDMTEPAAPHVDHDKGDDDGHDPIHG